VIATLLDQLTTIGLELLGPDSVVPWWAWAAVLVMIFWGLLGNHSMTTEADEDE
jgi:hypothetical protein